jgi:hypothetical protein
MNGVDMTSWASLPTVTDQTWQIVGVGDFNGDGSPDILWRNTSTGADVVWYMNGATMTSWAALSAVTDQTWQIVGVGDFNGDGSPDILWRNTSTGADVVWYMNGATMTSWAALSAVTDQTWQIVGVTTGAPPQPPTTYTIGGTVSDLSGTGLVLQNNGSNNLPVSASGGFTFSTPIASGGTYNVTVLTQPSSPAQTCVVTNSSGTANANVTSVQVTCATGSAISGLTYQLLTQRAVANQGSFYVYVDQDSGFNHGFPSGLFATTGNPANLGTIHIDTGCISDPNAANGCSTDPNALDRMRGTVMRVSFDPQTSGNFAGVNIEEPENWGVLKTGNGYDLRGAGSVSFDVSSPDGAMVQFGFGGCNTPFTQPIASTWTTITVALNSGSLTCTPDLSNVHILFAVATNDGHAASGATVLIDNIRFTPVPTAHQSALGFPLGNQTFGVLPQQDAPTPLDQVLRNLMTIYESALTELVLLKRGTQQDLSNARLIADTFDYALHHDSHGDPIPVAPDGSVALHNGYENGDIALFNNQQPPKQGLAGDIRLAGFTATTLCAPSGYCLVLDGATGGNNAFAILALAAAFEQFGDTRYLNDALTIGNWIVGNLRDNTGTGYGGYFLGYPDLGVPPPKPLQTGKSIENNADIFAAFTALATIESQLGNSGAAASWTTAANVAGDFVMQMFDSTKGRFNVGTVPAGTPSSQGICPTGPQKGTEVINVCDFLDSNTFTTLALAGSPRYQNRLDWRQPVQYVLNNFAQTVTAGGTTFQGFNIVSSPVSGPNGVAWEFTGQAIEAMRYVDKLYTDNHFESSANTYLAQIAQAQTSAPFGDGLGLVAATLQGGDTLVPSQQCLETPYQCIAERVGLAASVWATLADQKLNVFIPFSVSGP